MNEYYCAGCLAKDQKPDFCDGCPNLYGEPDKNCATIRNTTLLLSAKSLTRMAKKQKEEICKAMKTS